MTTTGLFFIFGLAIGSFLNVLIYRLPRNLPITGRSFCPHCRKKLSWRDNIPLLSFMVLNGKCRLCRYPIGWQYPVVELVTGVLFVLTQIHLEGVGSNHLPGAQLGYYLFIISSLIVIFFTDLFDGIVPDAVSYPAIGLSVLFYSITTPLSITNLLLPAVGAFLFLALNVFTRGGGLGFGDVKLALVMGYFLGWPGIGIALYLSLLTAATVSVLLVLLGKKTMKSTIPFAPFLTASTIATFFFGDVMAEILSGY